MTIARRGPASPSVVTSLVAALLLGACAAPSSQPGSPQSAAAQERAGSLPAGPPGFSVAVRRGLPLTVGVYGVWRDVGSEEFTEAAPGDRPPRAVARVADGAPLPMLPDPQERLDDSVSIGAGFFIDGDGTIATAAHVIEDARTIVVKTNDRRVFEAELIGADEESDIALIRIPMSLPSTPSMGRSATLRSGDWVVAIGDPYGLTRSVAAGIVGGGARHFADDTDALFIQSDLALNPGNSGGPLLDTTGAIVGMNLRMMVGPYGTAGVSLSMPIELVMRLARQLTSGAQRTRPRLGANFEDVSPPAALAAGRLLADGAVVTSVQPGGFADRIGLRVDDIVVGFNGHALGDSADLVRSLLEWESEAGTRLTVYRDGDYLELAFGSASRGESPAGGAGAR
jgi:serine protease Do